MDYNILSKLINSKSDENEWLDYKQEWHKNKIELIRDILAFINTTHHQDCYLIFGIEDKTFKVIGVDNDDNRRSTQQIVDLLINQPLSSDIPKIKVETFAIDNKDVDVLTIFNTLNVPLFFTKDSNYNGKRIGAGQIITRIMDTNTPENKTASDIIVENLYRKRICLDKTIYERYIYLLERVRDWTYIDLEQKLLYNFDPSFYILIEPLSPEEDKNRIHDGDYYAWLINSSSFPEEWRIRQYRMVTAMYGQHKIFDFSCMLHFDRDRGLTIAPRNGRLGRASRDLYYYYFIKDSLDWKFMTLYIEAWNNHMSEEFNSAYYSAKKVFDNVVVYENNEEKEYVESYYKDSMTIKDLEDDFGVRIEPTNSEILELKKQNSEYGRLSLLPINIARVINKKLEELREYDK